jgi:hypothetical protein
VYAADAADGIPNEVVRMGVASTDDFFAVTRADGTLAATISQDGVLSGSQVNANNSLYYKGTELTTFLDRRPKGVVSAAYRWTDSQNNATSNGVPVPYLRVEVDMLPGRLYKVWTSGIKGSMDGGTTMRVNLRYTLDNIADIYNATDLTYQNITTAENSAVLQELFMLNGSAPKRVSFLILFMVISGGGQAAIRSSLSNPVRLVIEDMGTPHAGIGNGAHLNGAVVAPPAVNTYAKQYGCYNSMNYTGAGGQYAYDTGRMYQGLSPAGQGNLRSIGLFPDLTADLSGATINYVRVHFNFVHWYNNAGGTARIGLHGHTSIPGSFGSNGVVVSSGGWPKPGARWVDIPAEHWWGFKSGNYRGVTLEGDGTYGTYGYADRPVLEIGYTK